MCLLLIANNASENYKLIIAANRDEFYDRPALPAHFRNDNPKLLAGKDLKAGGTWLGITKQGRFAALTNYRDLRNIKPDAPSRGDLTTDFLKGSKSPLAYIEEIKNKANQYNGFNLVTGVLNELYYFSNQSNEIKKIENGISGLSNGLLDTPWPKVQKVKQKMKEMIDTGSVSEKNLFNLLYDFETWEDDLVPDTGVGIELEKLLSSVFIKSENYGTRCSTVITVDKLNKVRFTEKTYLPEKNEFSEVNFEFTIET